MMVVIKTGLWYKIVVIKIGNCTWNSCFNNTMIMISYGYLIRKITVLFYDSLINTEIFTLYGCV